MTLSLSGGLHLDGARSSSSAPGFRRAQGQSQSDIATAHLDRLGGADFFYPQNNVDAFDTFFAQI